VSLRVYAWVCVCVSCVYCVRVCVSQGGGTYVDVFFRIKFSFFVFKPTVEKQG